MVTLAAGHHGNLPGHSLLQDGGAFEILQKTMKINENQAPMAVFKAKCGPFRAPPSFFGAVFACTWP